MIEHKIYTYSDTTSFKITAKNKKIAILIKDGQTINQTQESRIDQQFYGKSVISGEKINFPDTYESVFLPVEDLKFDNKIRKWLYKNNDSWEIKDGNGEEWAYLYLSNDIIKKYNITTDLFELEDLDLVNNKKFMKEISEIILKDKKEAIDHITSQKTYKTLNLRSYQNQIIDRMLDSDKDKFLLFLATRFGKTLSCL